MIPLLSEQIEALEELQAVCRAIGVDVVMIGATALRAWIPDEYRLTEDADVALTLDVEELASLTSRLLDVGWRPDSRWEPRWHSSRGARVDLLPVGARARKTGRIAWPRAETVMRVQGFSHVFRSAVFHDLAPTLRMRVPPLHVLALLKIVSYQDAPATRQKDLSDLITILDRYEESSDRRFSDEVLDAGVQHDESGAFLLGCDLRALPLSSDEIHTVRQFLRRLGHRDFLLPTQLIGGARDNEADPRLFRQLSVLARGLGEQQIESGSDSQ